LADERITQLRELPQAALASGDVLPIVDLSASQTKKITVSSLMGAGISLVAPSSINLSVLDQNSATKLAAAALASGAVTAPKLAANSSISVGTVAPSGDNFTGRGFFNTSTSALQVFNGSSFQSVTPAVGTGSITGSQIASGTITPGLIASGTLTGAQMAGGTVTYANIQPTASGDVVIGRATTSGTLTESLARLLVAQSLALLTLLLNGRQWDWATLRRQVACGWMAAALAAPPLALTRAIKSSLSLVM
jgi:hypothetical protein